MGFFDSLKKVIKKAMRTKQRMELKDKKTVDIRRWRR